ncbi:N-acetyltransferase [Paenibacillus sp. YYML68]|uniref:GNAT family N-acetyltransferase n=1 Tax=Paenibacillus sp. YYML68 TaxID=2909250 RepID=UPI0024937EDB|nr:GNAT family N-acetyltransferase [Paenibacillus sp. YYML68]
MLRKRVPSKDDSVIFQLVEEELLPYARLTKPGLKLTRPELRKRLRRAETYVEVTAGRQAAGFITLKLDRERVTVDLLAVHPRYQGKGIGKRMMQLAERKAQVKGLKEAALWVDEANGKARMFYERLGYRPAYYDRNLRCMLMVKSLQSGILE